MLSPNKTIECSRLRCCPKCNSTHFFGHGKKSKIVTDLKFMRHGIKRWIIRLPIPPVQVSRLRSHFLPRKKSLDRKQDWFWHPCVLSLPKLSLRIAEETYRPQSE